MEIKNKWNQTPYDMAQSAEMIELLSIACSTIFDFAEPTEPRDQVLVERRLDLWDAAELSDIQSASRHFESGYSHMVNLSGIHLCA